MSAAEVQREVASVWRFLIDREIEAPERYSAIQSYRAAMAVLRQQGASVIELVKVVREVKGISLAEAKRIVDESADCP